METSISRYFVQNLLIKSKKQISLVARLKDKFGDHGITALAISKQKKKRNKTDKTPEVQLIMKQMLA